MRTAAVLLLLALTTAACSSGAPAAATPPGCGLVPESRVVGLLGTDVRSRLSGSLDGLRTGHRRLTCFSTVPSHPERFVRVVAVHHPRPLQLPARSCSEGWVYAGTPDKYAPACQETVDGHGRTELVVRWQPYVVRVTVGRTRPGLGRRPRGGAGDEPGPRTHLGVAEAAGS